MYWMIYFPILYKKQPIVQEMKSFESAVTSRSTIWIHILETWLSTIMEHVSQFVSIIIPNIRCSPFCSWNQYTIFIISTIIYVLYKHNWSPSRASTSKTRSALRMMYPIICNMYIMMNQKFISACQSIWAFILSKICWILDIFQ